MTGPVEQLEAQAPRPRVRSAPAVLARRALARRVLPTALYVLADVAAVALAFYVAWVARYQLAIGGDVLEERQVEFASLLPVLVLIVGCSVLLFALQGLYRLPRWSPWFDDLATVLMSSGVAVMAAFTVSSFLQQDVPFLFPFSRLVFAYTWILATVFVGLGRLLVQLGLGQLFRRGLGVERVLVVGNNHLGRMIMQSLANQPDLGFQVVGFLDQERAGRFGRFPRLGALDDLPAVVNAHDVDQVIIALPSASHESILKILDHCRRDGVSFKLVPDLYEMRLSQVELATVMGIPLIGMRPLSIQGPNLLIKRALDVTLAALALLCLAPLIAAIALLIKLDSPGPVFYRQVRVGRGGRHFTIYKFRSMRPDADRLRDELLTLNEADGPVFKIRRDPRITRVGRFLRRTSLDELPQLWNVLRGDMSLVGPRPPIPAEVERYEAWQRRRLDVSPGLTGLQQVSGRSELSFDEWVMLDIYYIENWSLGLDLRILLRTLPAVLSGRGAF